MKSPVFDFQRIPACLLALATFFVAIKPAPCNLFLFLAVVSVFVSPQHRASLRQHTLSAPGLAAIGFFLLMCATQLYSHSAWAQAQEYVWKYMRIAYLPFLAAALLDERDQTLVLKAFVAAMLLTLFLSFGNALVPGFCAALNLTNCGPPSNPFVFKQHITHGFFMALAAGLLGFWAYQQRNLVWAVLAALATFNVLYMLEGRTGWLVVLTFLVISATVYMGWKKALLLSAITLLPCLWYLFVSIEQHPMLVQALDEYWQWRASGVAPGRSGMRLTYYSHAIQAIAQHPWFGHGLGGVSEGLNLAALEPKIYALNNPHNQYLLFAVQAGMFGLLAYLGLLLMLFLNTSQSKNLRMPSFFFLVAFMVVNCLNSFHFDMSEAILFAIAGAIFFFRKRHGESPSSTP